jgi:hypothetical protein
MEMGDQVVFRDGKDGRRYDAKIVGFDGPNSLLRRGNMDRCAPTAELLPSFATRQDTPEVANEDQPKESVSDNEIQETSDTEIIEEIKPRRRGPKRKKKIEIIPEIPEKKVVRRSKRRAMQEETDDEITQEVWSEDEDMSHMRKNNKLTKPKLNYHIRAWNTFGEEFSGEVIDLKPKSKTTFKIREHETSVELCVDLNKINQWEYIAEPKLDDKTASCLLAALKSGTRDAEDYAQYEYIYFLNDGQYYEYG